MSFGAHAGRVFNRRRSHLLHRERRRIRNEIVGVLFDFPWRKGKFSNCNMRVLLGRVWNALSLFEVFHSVSFEIPGFAELPRVKMTRRRRDGKNESFRPAPIRGASTQHVLTPASIGLVIAPGRPRSPIPGYRRL